MSEDVGILRSFMASAHQVDDDAVADVGEVPHERMAGLTMEQIMSGTGLNRARLRQAMMAAEHDIDTYTHEVHDTRYALRGSTAHNHLLKLGFAHNHGPSFEEE
jgi:hypothetical protein